MRALMPILLLVLGGCLTHLPPNALAEKRYLELDWAPGFGAARERATELGRPILVMLVAGQLDGPC